MSYDFIVYLQAQQAPTTAEVQTRISPALRFAEGLPDLLKDDGFVPVTHLGRRTGFELMQSNIAADEYEEGQRLFPRKPGEVDDPLYVACLTTCDRRIYFTGRDEAEVAAARIVAHALAELAHGYFCDPQTDETEHLG
jgi:hypothetical protein